MPFNSNKFQYNVVRYDSEIGIHVELYNRLLFVKNTIIIIIYILITVTRC